MKSFIKKLVLPRLRLARPFLSSEFYSKNVELLAGWEKILTAIELEKRGAADVHAARAPIENLQSSIISSTYTRRTVPLRPRLPTLRTWNGSTL